MAALIYAILSQTANAEDRRTDALHETTKANVRVLGDREFQTRQNAYDILRTELEDAVDERNPLPPIIHHTLDPHNARSPEQRIRMEKLSALLRTTERQKPGRIISPRENKRSLHDVLEEQFGMPIKSHDPIISKMMRQYDGCESGTMSTHALHTLCRHLESIPVLTTSGIELERATPYNRFNVNDKIIRTTRSPILTSECRIYYAPDKGAILSLAARETPPLQTMPVAVTDSVTVYAGLQTWAWFPQSFNAMEGCSYDALVATDPMTKTVNIEEGASVTLGSQTFTITKVTRSNDGCLLAIEGSVLNILSFEKEHGPNLWGVQQMVRSNSFLPSDIEGKFLPAGARLRFNGRTYNGEINIVGQATSLTTRGFTDMQEEDILVP